MARPPLLCQGGDFAFPAGCPRRPCPADDLWVTLKRWCKEGNNALSQLIHTFGVVIPMRCFETHSKHVSRTDHPSFFFTPVRLRLVSAEIISANGRRGAPKMCGIDRLRGLRGRHPA